MAAIVSENYQLKWHSFGAHLHSSVATSLNSDAFTDVCLFTLDGHQINAHRFVLATCSQYLQQVRGLWRPRSETPANANKSEKNTLSKTPVKVIQKPGNILKPLDSNVKTNDSAEKKVQKPNEISKEESNNQEHQKSDNSSSDEIENKKIESKTTSNASDKDSDTNESEKNKDDVNYLVIKEEPLEWNDFQEVDMNESEMFHTEMTIKPEILFPADDPEYQQESEEMYSPLTCELCSETYTLPAEWVRHIRTHTDMQPAKRRRSGRPLVEDDDNFPPLQCDLCQKQFPTPGEWVRHIQNTHTDTELAESNHGIIPKSRIIKPVGVTHKTCTICNKKFPSHASMLIHRRTHTGERPFVCDFCQKGFNVKSNLLRHLRTLHDKIINSSDVIPDGN